MLLPCPASLSPIYSSSTLAPDSCWDADLFAGLLNCFNHSCWHLGPRLLSTCLFKLDSFSVPLAHLAKMSSSHPPPARRTPALTQVPGLLGRGGGGGARLNLKRTILCDYGDLSGLFLLEIYSLSLSLSSFPSTSFLSVLSSFFLFLFHNVKSIPLNGFSLTNSAMWTEFLTFIFDFQRGPSPYCVRVFMTEWRWAVSRWATGTGLVGVNHLALPSEGGLGLCVPGSRT